MIYEEDLNYHILDKKENIVGSFYTILIKFYIKKQNKLKELDNIINDYTFFIYKNKKFYDINNIADGELIKESLKTNILKIKSSTKLLKISDMGISI